MNFATWLKTLREKRGLLQKELASKVGCTPEAVSQWETGRREPNNLWRKKLAEFFGREGVILLNSWVEYGSQELMSKWLSQAVREKGLTPSGENKWIYLPLLGCAPTGKRSIEEEEVEEWIPFLKVDAKSRRLYILRVRGDSMNKAGIENGDRVIVNADGIPKNGSIVVVRVDGEATIKRWFRVEDQVTLMPDSMNPEHKATIVDLKRSEVLLRGVVDSIWCKKVR